MMVSEIPRCAGPETWKVNPDWSQGTDIPEGGLQGKANKTPRKKVRFPVGIWDGLMMDTRKVSKRKNYTISLWEERKKAYTRKKM